MPNEEEDSNVYDILPRLGSFEVSTVFPSRYISTQLSELTDILFFSKLSGKGWPNIEKVSNRVNQYLNELGQSVPRFGQQDIQIDGDSLKQKY